MGHRGRGRVRGMAVLGAAMAAGILGGRVGRAQTAAPGYADSVQFAGLAGPTALAFAPDGRVFVAEKRGMVQVFDSLASPTPHRFADLRTSVHNFWDRGLLGLALPPDFPATPYVYVLYTYDAPPGGTAPTWGVANQDDDGCPTPPGATTDGCVVQGRLSRLKIDAGGAWDGTEEVLIQDWCQQFPSHSIGALHFGADGMLYASGGEGAGFNSADWGQLGGSPGSPVPSNPCGDPPGGVGGTMTRPTAEGGALRSQQVRTTRTPIGPSGAVIRIDPATGLAAAGNPLAGAPTPGVDRLVAYGLRNPFRFAVRPGTNDLYVGDVGWTDWEEVNRVPDALQAPVPNFGWPCYEGPDPTVGFNSLGLALCDSLYAVPAQVTAPFFRYNHAADVVAGDRCGHGSSSISGLAFQQGALFPPALAGALFVADYSRRCIWALQAGPDGVPDPARIVPLVSDAAAPVDLAVGPDGGLYYADLLGGTVHRVRWTQGIGTPKAVATATPSEGPAPLAVRLDGSGSSDPNPGGGLTYAWDTDVDGVFDHVGEWVDMLFDVPGTYRVRLRVTDPLGQFADDVVTVSVGNTAPRLNLDAPPASLQWFVGETVDFAASASDAQDGPLPPSAFTWSLVLHHCQRATPSDCHAHPLSGFDGIDHGTFVAPDHEWPSYLELAVTATDSLGATDRVDIRLDPRDSVVRLASKPAGLVLETVSDRHPAPFDWTAITGSAVQVAAPSPQAFQGQDWQFASWSDGGAATHVVTATVAPITITATYVVVPVCGDGIVGYGEQCDDGPLPTGCCTSTCGWEEPGFPCDDRDACTATSSCLQGTCVGGEATVCTPPDRCVVAAGCVPATGCVFAPADCDDGNECTDDSCDGSTGCLHAPRQDGAACAGGSGACVQGTCLPLPEDAVPDVAAEEAGPADDGPDEAVRADTGPDQAGVAEDVLPDPGGPPDERGVDAPEDAEPDPEQNDASMGSEEAPGSDVPAGDLPGGGDEVASDRGTDAGARSAGGGCQGGTAPSSGTAGRVLFVALGLVFLGMRSAGRRSNPVGRRRAPGGIVDANIEGHSRKTRVRATIALLNARGKSWTRP